MKKASRHSRSPGYQAILSWMKGRGLEPFPYQQACWQHFLDGKSGLVHAPTGCGKTYALFLAALMEGIHAMGTGKGGNNPKGLQLLWITPLRSLAQDLGRAMNEVIRETRIPWKLGIRNGDTGTRDRRNQWASMPQVLIITPESLHLLLAHKGYPEQLGTLRTVVVDEWHELLGSKRGVLVELALSRIKTLVRERAGRDPEHPGLRVWGLSATLGQAEEAMEVLLGKDLSPGILVSPLMHKKICVQSIFPDQIEQYPWAGHLGLKLLPKIIPILEQSRTTLIFINTRGMAETWYQELLRQYPVLAGQLALHHGSMDRELRDWVEQKLLTGELKAVVCTSSLDLGVDFRPVDTIIQVGSPKGISRFLQRAGRSGHEPGSLSRIYFLPTHSLELVEASALARAIRDELQEQRQPVILAFDVLLQYLTTLALSEGFDPQIIWTELRTSWCYRDISLREWQWALSFLSNGGESLQGYDEFKKLEKEGSLLLVRDRKLAMRHRLHIGTIVSDPLLRVKYLGGAYIGMIEEYFISRLRPGDSFSLAGKTLELALVKDMTVLVRKSKSARFLVPSWNGGRMPLSSRLAAYIRQEFDRVSRGFTDGPELKKLSPLFSLQQELSLIPREQELLVESIASPEGHHVFVYPFEGRLVHETLAALMAFRISREQAITFSMAMNDYGFELLSDQVFELSEPLLQRWLSPEGLDEDIPRSINETEMARRKFRDIACIAGLVFQGYPGALKQNRHLQSSSGLFFNVFQEFDPGNLLYRQAYWEASLYQMERQRLQETLGRIRGQRIRLVSCSRLTPFSFPLKVDSLRESLSSEKLEDRIRHMQGQLEHPPSSPKNKSMRLP